VWEVIGKLEQLMGVRAIIQRESARQGDQRFTGADTSKLRKHLGWEAQTSLDAGLLRQVAWQRSQTQLRAAAA
jgi:nucleoside-diphosphate-sugar epimerase